MPTGKIPMRIELKSREPFAFAGLWEAWHSSSAETIHSCTIVTTTPNEVVEPLHNRMPVILLPEQEQVWLDNGVEDTDALTQLLTPYPEPMEAYEVSTAVNSVGNDSAELIVPVG